MAKVTKSALLSYLDAPSQKYEQDYSTWSNKAEWEVVGAVRNRIGEMYRARQGTCDLTNFDNSKSWDKHWEYLEKDYLMHSKFDGADNWKSNLKSSITYRTIAAIDARERKQEISFLVEARNETDEKSGKALTHRYIFDDYFRRNNDIRYKFLDVSKQAKIFGTSIAYIPYTTRLREVQYPDELNIDVEKLKGGELPKQTYKTKTIVDFEDVDFVPWDLKHFFIDPNAQYLHGTSYAATDAAGTLYLTSAQVKLMFQGDPEIKNLDKIYNPKNTHSFTSSFFNVPLDQERGYGELVFYYNIETDSEVIIFDDVLLKDGPNPYIDKKIPFVDFKFIRKPGSFYGQGVGDITMHVAAEDAAFKNGRIEQMHFAMHPPTLLGASIFGDVDEQWDRIEPGMILKVGDVSQARVLEQPGLPYDTWRISEELKDEAVMNTGVNPQGLNLPMASTPATNTLAMKENMSDMMNMYSDNLMAGMADWGGLLESRFCQFYSMPSKQKALELGKKEMRELRLEDIDLYTDKDGNYSTRETQGAKYIPLDKKMFEWNGSPRVYVSPDFISPISQALEMRKAQEVLPQLVQLSGDRGTPLPNGMPAVFDIRKLGRWYLKKMKMIDEDFLLDQDEDRMEEIQQAQKQQEQIQAGESIPGRPGEPTAHRYTHAVELMQLNDTVAAPEFSQMMEIGDPDMIEMINAIEQYRQELSEHLRTDSLLVDQAAEASVAEADQVTAQQQQPQQPAMGAGPMGMPMNNSIALPTVSGNVGLPNQGGMPVPNKMGPEDVSGQMSAM